MSPALESADSPESRQRLEEYKFLRAEIEAIWNQSYSTLNFMLALIGLIIVAAYAQKSDNVPGSAAVILAMGSLVTVGGYKMIGVHTSRVWRIVGYMRRVLEPAIPGINWETRLALRHAFLVGTSHTQVDRDLFISHESILDAVNFALLIAILYTELGDTNLLVVGYAVRSAWVSLISAAVPVGVLIRFNCSRKSERRAGPIETLHYDSWDFLDLERSASE